MKNPFDKAWHALFDRRQQVENLPSAQGSIHKKRQAECINSASLDLERLEDRTLLSVGSTLVPVAPPISYDAVLTLDIEQDGIAEVLAHVDRTGSWWLMSSDGSLTSLEPFASWPTHGQFEHIQLLDLDGDATPEIVGRSRVTGDWWTVSFGSGGVTAREIGSWDVGEGYERVLSGSFIADGQDAIVGYSAVEGMFRTLTIEDDIAVSFTAAAPVGFHDPSAFLVADTDGDGQEEAYARTSDGIWWRGVIGSTGLELQKVASWSTRHEFHAIRAADIDGDGSDEIIGRNSTGTWWGIFNDGGTYTNRYLNGWSTSTSYATILSIDIEGDGTESIVGRDVKSGRWWALVYAQDRWINRALPIWSTSSSFTDIQVVDRDGDGDQEIIGRQTTTGTWWALDPSQNRNFAVASWNPQTPVSHIVVTNLNGDSKVDFLGLASETGVFWTIQSTDAGYRHGRVASWNVDWRDQSYQSTVVGTDADLVQLIYRQVPGLIGSIPARGLDALELLRDWTANATNFALDGQTATVTNYGISRRTAADLYYRTFLPNTGGVYCGGMAVFASKVYRLFGFASFTVDFGQLADHLTHVSVIVSVPSGGSPHHYIFDPTFNGSFVKANGEYATINDLLSAVIHGQQLEFRDRPMDMQDFVGTAINDSLHFIPQPGTLLYAYKWPTYGIDQFLAGFMTLLDKHGYSIDPMALGELLSKRVFSIEVNDQTAARNALIGVLQAYGVPIGPG